MIALIKTHTGLLANLQHVVSIKFLSEADDLGNATIRLSMVDNTVEYATVPHSYVSEWMQGSTIWQPLEEARDVTENDTVQG